MQYPTISSADEFNKKTKKRYAEQKKRRLFIASLIVAINDKQVAYKMY